MARIEGVDLPREKRIEIGLTYIYGIGRPTSLEILDSTGVNPDIRVRDLSEGFAVSGPRRMPVLCAAPRRPSPGVVVVAVQRRSKLLHPYPSPQRGEG